MKNRISFLIITILISFGMQSCKEKRQVTKQTKSSITPEPKKENTIPSEFKNQLRPNQKLKLGEIYTDTVHFIKTDTDYDYWMLSVEKNKETVHFVYTENYQFTKGDEIEIRWKIDSLREAGDDEILYFKEHLVSAKKLQTLKLKEKKLKLLWREKGFDKTKKIERNTIVLNHEFIATISDPEKAALAYIATFIGNECQWEKGSDNLKCKIIDALNLGYQCSDTHLDFLKYWFRNNKSLLSKLKRCQKKPDGATIQTTFQEINLEVNSDTIVIGFNASGINLRERETFTWTEKQYFEFKEDELRFLKTEKSPFERKSFEIEEEANDTIDTQQLLLLTKTEAIEKHGTPLVTAQFILDDVQGEFRVEISDKYTQKERQTASIVIDEITWKKNKGNWLTVWYEVVENESVPKHFLIWEKGSEF